MEWRRSARYRAGMIAAFTIALLLAGGPPPGPPPKPLYVRLGGPPKIEALVSDWLGRMTADKRLTARFGVPDPAKVESVRVVLLGRLCKTEAGHCIKGGNDPMPAAPAVVFNDDDFAAVLDDLQKAMLKAGLRSPEKDEVMIAYWPMKQAMDAIAAKAARAAKLPARPAVKPAAKR